MIHVLTDDETWSAPIEALLREQGHVPTRSPDPFEAIDGVRATGWGVVVVGADADDDDVELLLRLLDRHVGDKAVVFGIERDNSRFLQVFARYDFVALRDAVSAHITERSETIAAADSQSVARQRVENAELAAAPVDEEELQRLLRLARHEDYYTFIGVPRSAENELVEARISALRARLAAERLPHALLEEHLDAIREVREALRDVEIVLTDTSARQTYAPARKR